MEIVHEDFFIKFVLEKFKPWGGYVYNITAKSASCWERARYLALGM